MGSAAMTIPIQHSQLVYAVETTDCERPQQLTLLELVESIADVTDDEREIVATAMYMLRSGRVRLAGNFHDEPVSEFV